MGGFFGVASKSDCVFDLFFGTDYHSHLGTKRGGMAVYGKDGFERAIHNIENAPFRTKFERDVEMKEREPGHRLHFRHRAAAAHRAFAPRELRHQHGRAHQQRRHARPRGVHQRNDALSGDERRRHQSHRADGRAHQPARLDP